MMSLRRASLLFRSRVQSIRVCSHICDDTELSSTKTRDQSCIYDTSEFGTNRCLVFTGFHCNKHTSASLSLARRGFATRTSIRANIKKKPCNSEELRNRFSDLETDDGYKASSRADSVDKSIDELIFGAELSECDGEDDAEIFEGADRVFSKNRHSVLLNTVRNFHPSTIPVALKKWVEEGNVTDREETDWILARLQNLRLYNKALVFSEWLEESNTIKFTEKDYASRLYLVVKVHGLARAEKYIDRIPESLRSNITYEALLACCVEAFEPKKAEEIFKIIKDNFTLTEFACNQMILIYRETDHLRITDVLELMESKNIKPTVVTYNTLVDMKGQHGDIAGMEKVLENMKAHGIKPDRNTRYHAAMSYALVEMKEKAEAYIRLIEGDGFSGPNRVSCQMVLRLYGELGLAKEVDRVWKDLQNMASPCAAEHLAAIEAFGKVKRVKDAERVFGMFVAKTKKRQKNLLHYNALLKVYVDNKMLEMGKDFARLMEAASLQIGPVTWDLLVRLYIAAGDWGKADSILVKASDQRNSQRPLRITYESLMEGYSNKGDTHNTEKMLVRLRDAGYHPSVRDFRILVRAYMVAKLPVYGMVDRIKADNIVPNKGLLRDLEIVNPFKKSSVSGL